MQLLQTQKMSSETISSTPDSGVCAQTNKPLWEVNSQGAVLYLEPHGQCDECHRWFHIDAMKTFTVHKDPLRFTGYLCKTCHGRPLSKNDPLSKIKLMGI